MASPKNTRSKKRAKTRTYCENAREARGKWDKENNYYNALVNIGVCLDCINFSINHDHPCYGKCAVIKQAFQEEEFTKKGVTQDVVSTTGICENFTNIHGIGLDGKITMPQLLPAWIKTHKDKKTGELYIT
jgi:hypothetical protein